MYSGIKRARCTQIEMYLDRELRRTCIDMYSYQYVLESTCARINMYSDQEIKMYTGHDVLGSRYARNQDVLGSGDQYVLESIVSICTHINMYSYQLIGMLGSRSTRIERSRCTRIRRFRCKLIKMYADQDALESGCSDRYVFGSICTRINMYSGQEIKMHSVHNVLGSRYARNQYVLIKRSICTRIKRSICT
jgi:hypothetical protein